MTLKVGDRAPDFTLSAGSGAGSSHDAPSRSMPAACGQFTLSEALAKGPVVLFFYPKDDTPGCTAEACTFRDRYDDFTVAGAQVVGVSSDSLASHDSFAQKHRLPMTLLSDADGRVRKLYDVRPTLGLFPGRATFVIDPGGVVRHVFVSQLRVGTHVEQALATVKELTAKASP
jgi:peroxiredoxin Q/BCP